MISWPSVFVTYVYELCRRRRRCHRNGMLTYRFHWDASCGTSSFRRALTFTLFTSTIPLPSSCGDNRSNPSQERACYVLGLHNQHVQVRICWICAYCCWIGCCRLERRFPWRLTTVVLLALVICIEHTRCDGVM